MASSSLTLKGCPLNGCSSDSGISCIFSSLASWRLSSVENKSSYGASSTFFALLFKFYHLLGQILIALGHLAIRVMGKNAFALGADLLCPDRMGNLGDQRRRSEEHTSELQSRFDLVCRLLLEKKKTNK